MMRIMYLLLFCTLIAGVPGQLQFLNPAPSGQRGDFSNIETYTQGSTVNVAWTGSEPGKRVSLVLYQLDNAGLWFGEMEYLTQGAVGVSRYTWLVGTRKNLTSFNMFYMTLFQEGKNKADNNSRYFYIKENKVEQSTAVSTTPSPSSAQIASASSTASAPGASFIPPTISTTPAVSSSNLPSTTPQTAQSETSSNVFPIAAKIGIGVGIPGALAIGLGIGYVLFRRHKKNYKTSKPAPNDTSWSFSPTSPDTDRYQYKGAFYASHLNEAPPKSPIELGPHPMPLPRYPQRTERLQQTPCTEPVRYEM